MFRWLVLFLPGPFFCDDISLDKILTHSYSGVVMQTLLWAYKRKRNISIVFVTEARPCGLGFKIAEKSTAAGIPTIVILDSAVAYCMDMVDSVLVGSEAMVESGGLINAVGSNQIAIIAKAANKLGITLLRSRSKVPYDDRQTFFRYNVFYTAYNLSHRLFLLSQYDLRSHTPNLLSFSPPKGLNLRDSSVNPSPKLSSDRPK
ncbi:IF-2B-domain-containing protein [Armillaria gallica]|uniref:IF-2B-domain-containing protein n=1 Tax=Armillaria gallica TaxID=47427 RepID=A0A2H3DR64_ARMGA|nr:IF-2B-domain-containing protein [Armillaria gallica]PBK97710.1 IF-2B-domain-containing protein [Armillaria gallica]